MSELGRTRGFFATIFPGGAWRTEFSGNRRRVRCVDRPTRRSFCAHPALEILSTDSRSAANVRWSTRIHDPTWRALATSTPRIMLPISHGNYTRMADYGGYATACLDAANGHWPIASRCPRMVDCSTTVAARDDSLRRCAIVDGLCLAWTSAPTPWKLPGVTSG